MLSWFSALMPKEDRFYPLFDRHAEKIVEAADALRQVLNGGDQTAAYCQIVAEREDDADAIIREVLEAVRRTFITPFDRGDIKDLITSMDDAIDQMKKTTKVIGLFEQRSFDPAMAQMADCIVEAAQLTREAVHLLPNMRKNAGRLHTLTEQIIKVEDRSDTLYDDGRRALFAAHRGDPMAFIVGVDIYSHLEKVVDRFEDVANRISGIVIEQV